MLTAPWARLNAARIAVCELLRGMFAQPCRWQSLKSHITPVVKSLPLLQCMVVSRFVGEEVLWSQVAKLLHHCDGQRPTLGTGLAMHLKHIASGQVLFVHAEQVVQGVEQFSCVHLPVALCAETGHECCSYLCLADLSCWPVYSFCSGFFLPLILFPSSLKNLMLQNWRLTAVVIVHGFLAKTLGVASTFLGDR